MPDADIVHRNLPRLYQMPYRDLCEGKDSPQECAWTMMRALLKDIQGKGAVPITLAKQMGELLDREIKNASSSNSLDWTATNKKLERLAWRTNLAHHVRELALRAGKSVVHDLRYRRKLGTGSLSETVINRYMEEVYKADFKERIPLTSEHYLSVDGGVLEERIEDIEFDMSKGIKEWANQLNKGGDLDKLKRPRRSKINEVDLEEDLL